MRHELAVASAQVKSCILLAGLRAEGETEIAEPGASRDHTERMIRYAGGRVERRGAADGRGVLRVWPVDRLSMDSLAVPGDFSSAAFFMVAAQLIEDSEVTVENAGLESEPHRAARGAGPHGRVCGCRAAADRRPRARGAHHRSDIGSGGHRRGGGRSPERHRRTAALPAGGRQGEGGLASSRRRRTPGQRKRPAGRHGRAPPAPWASRWWSIRTAWTSMGSPEGWTGGAIVTEADHRVAMCGAIAGAASAARDHDRRCWLHRRVLS